MDQPDHVLDIQDCTWVFEYIAGIGSRLDAVGASWPEFRRIVRLLSDGLVQREHKPNATETLLSLEWRSPDVAEQIEAAMAEIEAPATGARKFWRAVWKLWPFRRLWKLRPKMAA